MKEELELVTDFATLRAGMLVVYQPCFYCSKPHRMILLRRSRGWAGAEGWAGEPSFSCNEDIIGISQITVAARKVYSVVDPDLEAPAESTHEKRPEVVR